MISNRKHGVAAFLLFSIVFHAYQMAGNKMAGIQSFMQPNMRQGQGKDILRQEKP